MPYILIVLNCLVEDSISIGQTCYQLVTSESLDWEKSFSFCKSTLGGILLQPDINSQEVPSDVRGAFKLKNVPNYGKSPKGSAQKIKKSKIRNLDFLTRGGGEDIFSFFSQM